MRASHCRGRCSLSYDVVRVAAACAIACATPIGAYAQDVRDTPAAAANGRRTISGVVFDSIALRPLSGAHVHLADLARETTADSLGRFRFDEVGPGVHAVWADHPMIDQIGLYSLGIRVDATPQLATHVTIAIPSFTTLWHRACGEAPVPSKGEGFVFGRVLSGDVGASPSTIDIAWHASRNADAHQSGRPDMSGSYAICGVPAQQPLLLSATSSAGAPIPVWFRLGPSRVARRDITLPSVEVIAQLTADPASVAPGRNADGATITGLVRDSAGTPVRDARVTVSGMTGEWRTNWNGEFVARAVPVGTRALAIRGVGFEPERRLVDLAPHDSAQVDVTLLRLVTKLSTITVREREHFNEVKSEIDQRRRAGFGYRSDSLELAHLPGLMEAFNFPGVRFGGTPAHWGVIMSGVSGIPSKKTGSISLGCTPTVWLDGRPSDFGMLNELHKEEVALIEVYNSAARAPLQFTGNTTLCGVILVWQKSYVNPPR